MGRGRDPHQCLALLQPLSLPSDCMLAQPGTPLHIPPMPVQGRGWDRSWHPGDKPTKRQHETGSCKMGHSEWSSAGGKPWAVPQCPAQLGQGRPSLPACMYFSSCSRRCSTSAGVSVKIFFGGKAGTTLAPYSFRN